MDKDDRAEIALSLAVQRHDTECVETHVVLATADSFLEWLDENSVQRNGLR